MKKVCTLPAGFKSIPSPARSSERPSRPRIRVNGPSATAQRRQTTRPSCVRTVICRNETTPRGETESVRLVWNGEENQIRPGKRLDLRLSKTYSDRCASSREQGAR